MMIDMREPLTVDFHKAKRRADLLRPEGPDGASAADVEQYRDAVHAYAAAFDVAEQEAKRRRRGDFSPLEQERLAKAQRLLAVAGAGQRPDGSAGQRPRRWPPPARTRAAMSRKASGVVPVSKP